MLVVGLHSYGECDRIQQETRAAQKMGLVVEPKLSPVMLTAGYEAAAFAEALSWLEYVDSVEK